MSTNGTPSDTPDEAPIDEPSAPSNAESQLEQLFSSAELRADDPGSGDSDSDTNSAADKGDIAETVAPARTKLSIITGSALILLPLWGVVFKGFSAGWLLIVLIVTGIVLLAIAGYVLQLVIASQGFLTRNALFGSIGNTSSKRATIAAWLTSLGVLGSGIFLPDSGDQYYGSTFQVWLGAYSENAESVHAASDALNDVAAMGFAAAWLVGFFWLLVEWIVALVRRRRANQSHA